jgi:hypothetical protein
MSDANVATYVAREYPRFRASPSLPPPVIATAGLAPHDNAPANQSMKFDHDIMIEDC